MKKLTILLLIILLISCSEESIYYEIQTSDGRSIFVKEVSIEETIDLLNNDAVYWIALDKDLGHDDPHTIVYHVTTDPTTSYYKRLKNYFNVQNDH